MSANTGLLANSRLGYTLRNLGIRVAFRELGVRECVDSTSRPFEFALIAETNEILPRKADGLDIAGPEGLFQYVIT